MPTTIPIETQLKIIKEIKAVAAVHRNPKKKNLEIAMINGAALTLNTLHMLPPFWHMNVMAGAQDRILNLDQQYNTNQQQP